MDTHGEQQAAETSELVATILGCDDGDFALCQLARMATKHPMQMPLAGMTLSEVIAGQGRREACAASYVPPADDEEEEAEGPVEVSLMVLPNPASEMDPDEASVWLRETMPHYVEMLGEASEEVDPVDCGDSFYTIANDLKKLIKGCHEAIDRSVPVRLSPDMKGGDSNSIGAIDMLATFVAGAAAVDDLAEESRSLLGFLAHTLSRRIKAERAFIERCRDQAYAEKGT